MDISSINTGVDLLNRHVQSKDFFNVAEFPIGRFVADQLDFAARRSRDVDGTLTLHGPDPAGDAQGQPLQLLPEPADQAPGLRRRLRDDGARSDFGIDWGLNFGFEDRVRLLVQVEAVNVSGAPAS